MDGLATECGRQAGSWCCICDLFRLVFVLARLVLSGKFAYGLGGLCKTSTQHAAALASNFASHSQDEYTARKVYKSTLLGFYVFSVSVLKTLVDFLQKLSLHLHVHLHSCP